MMKKLPGRREWFLDGHEVSQIRVDHRFVLCVWWRGGDAETTAEIIIEVPFSVMDGVRLSTCDPAKPESVGPALALFGRKIKTLSAFRNGVLHLLFIDQAILQVHPSRDGHESWQTIGTGELADMGMLCTGHEGPPWPVSWPAGRR